MNNNSKFTASEVARFIVAYLYVHGYEPVTNRKLNKLLYYAQAWYYTFFKETLFDDDFDAWANGPCIPTVFNEFRKFRYEPINVDAIDISEELLNSLETFVYDKYGLIPHEEVTVEPNSVRKANYLFAGFYEKLPSDRHHCLDRVIAKFTAYSNFELEHMIHNEKPFLNARRGLQPLDESVRVIEKQDILEFYTMYHEASKRKIAQEKAKQAADNLAVHLAVQTA